MALSLSAGAILLARWFPTTMLSISGFALHVVGIPVRLWRVRHLMQTRRRDEMALDAAADLWNEAYAKIDRPA